VSAPKPANSQQPESTINPWIVSPAFDLLFIANVWWVVLSLPFFVVADGTSPVSFWQIYFLTTPHRWLTLLLVATDPDRRVGKGGFLFALAVIFGLVICGTHALTGAFTCLALIDYIWNAWHFASQHGGVLRIYGRKGGGGRPKAETRIMRIFVTYVCLRLAGWTTGWTEDITAAATFLDLLDLAVFLLPLVLLSMEFSNRPWQRIGKIIYLMSVLLMYGALLLAVRNGWHRWIIALTPANAAFHAVEYMAIVTFYARRRESHGSVSLFQTMARSWSQVLVIYVICLGIFSEFAERTTQGIWSDQAITLSELWVGANLWAAFLHYAYDGTIWKLRRPDTAKALGVELQRSP
jgi:hypothetical protein